MRLHVQAREQGSAELGHCSFEGGVLELEAASLSAADGFRQQLELVARSGHLGDWLGELKPRFALRPLWWRGANFAVDHLVQCLQRWGYNAAILPQEQLTQESLLKLQQAHIRVYAEATGEGLEELIKEFPELTGVLWQSRWLSDEWVHDPDQCQFDLLLAECRRVESSIGERECIFWVPSGSAASAEVLADSFSQLCDAVGARTSLAFASYKAGHGACHGTEHPVWEALRREPDSSATALLPICNAGYVGHGAGYWPGCNSRIVEQCCAQMRRHNFAGMLSLTKSLPAPGSLLDASLWVAGMRQCYDMSADALWKTWFLATQKEDPVRWLPLLHEVDRLIASLASTLALPVESKATQESTDLHRLRAESLLAQLKLLAAEHVQTQRGALGEDGPLTLTDQLHLFLRDAKKMVWYFLQRHSISLPNVLSGDDMQDSPWAEMESSPGRGMRGGTAKVALREHVLDEGTDPRLAKLHAEVQGQLRGV